MHTPYTLDPSASDPAEFNASNWNEQSPDCSVSGRMNKEKRLLKQWSS